MKAIVETVKINTTVKKLEPGFIIYDENGVSPTISVGVGLLDIFYTTLPSKEYIHNLIIAGVVDYAVNTEGITGFTAKDVVSTGFPFPTFHEAQITTGVRATVNGKNTGKTIIWANTSGRKFLPLNFTLYTTNVSGAGQNPAGSIGSNDPDCDDARNAVPFAGTAATGKIKFFNVDNDANPVLPGGELCINITDASTRTTFDFIIVATGIFVD